MLLRCSHHQFSRALCRQWRHLHSLNGVGFGALQINKCAPLRLQARSRLGGGELAGNYKWLWIMPRRWSASDGKDTKDPASQVTVEKVGQAKKDDTGGTQTKFEVKTPKGILSITTTIEDSKINEIVFEKTDLSPLAKLNEPALNIIATDTIATVSNPPPVSAASVLPTSRTENIEIEATIPPVAAAPKRPRFDYRISLERNFVTPARAISDFMLSASDLEKLPKIKRRSPYEQEPPMTVYWRRDVEAKALEVWGSRESIVRERLKRELERKQYQQNVFTVKRRLRDYRREMGSRTKVMLENSKDAEKSGQVVATAIAINAANLLFKAGGWLYSGSHSMFAEVIHSLADLINQLILAFGIYKSSQVPDTDHPYGYMNMRYVSSLISGVGIFCVGSGLSIYHGIEGIIHPQPIADLFWVYCILAGSLVSEGATLVVAINELKRSARVNNMSFKDYVISGKDPCVNVVLCEDAAAVAGVMIAGTCMGLSSYTGSPLFDAAGSLVIGALLGAVASFIIYTNANALVGVSISMERLEKINTALEADVMIRAIYDVKGIDIGNGRVRYKAELDFDGRELTRSYLDKQDLNKLLTTVRGFRNVDDLESFLLDQGENIVDLMGGEIDRIEMNLRTQFPEIRHVDLEIL
ncbi:proton-coupled zinc antiporter SLC30A9, mitochondrial [Drosophila nasuta]|uniref:proton-coupled zinc antiporter SLC30A9, mitochondrial n=1 Tax=Drosophila nasuta TaxID=42062 RepID=UPI00295F3DD5|nr:proton-coupled zinc antiporter SLC30A9, mitochondrial [Drosophila nasuta]XP_060654435.1 proton-coupled zinc antiporter SLC30A9, mitochondrial [Drosophila nasuta]XP_060654437.1 proton-coupled zinc antiporter SLC30A9, mitochondrial [Drosophila nasuta]